MGKGIRILLIIGVVAAGGLAGLIYLGQMLKPNPAPIEKELPDETFPR